MAFSFPQVRVHRLTSAPPFTSYTMTLEICAEDIQSCLNAQKGGARRIELCTALDQGGLTPGSGLIQIARQYVTLPIHVLVRPRPGDFIYDRRELAVMRREIENCKAMGCDGVVIGALDEDGDIDARLIQQWVEVAYPMEVTFHRAFDLVSGPLEALELLADCGVSRVLTSGGAPKAIDALEKLKQFVDAAPEQLSIQVGSGVNAANIPDFYVIGIRDFHLSAREPIESPVSSDLFEMDYFESGLEHIQEAVKVIKGLYRE